MGKIPRLRAVSPRDEIRVEKKVPELLRVPWDKPLTGICLCTTLFEFPTHFDGEHTVICPGELTCELHTVRPLRVYYLLALLDRNTGVRAWYQLPDRAANALLQELREKEMLLLGSTITIGRERKSQKAPVRVSIDPYAKTPDLRGKPLDPQETIERVFSSPKLARKANLKVV
jgi:hypothetical protein